MFGNRGIGGGKGSGRIMKYMMLSQMLKEHGKTDLLPLMLLAGGGNGFDLGSAFDMEDDDTDEQLI